MPWQALLEVAAAGNALLLAAVLLASARLTATRSRLRLAGFLVCIAWLLTTFALLDQQWIALSPALVIADHFASLLLSALFADYLCGALGYHWRLWWLYLPASLFLTAGIIAPEWIYDNVGVMPVVLVHALYTISATVILVLASRRLVNTPRHLLYLLGGMWSLDLAQFIRWLNADVGWIYDAVPLVGVAFIVGLSVLVMTDSRALRRYTLPAVTRETQPGLTLDDLDRLMSDERPWLDTRLSVDNLAKAVGVPARDLSQLINRQTGASFYDYLGRFRVAHAKTILSDPSESRTSVEAVGLMSGFRARSTFYEAFRRETGQSPAQFRERQHKSG